MTVYDGNNEIVEFIAIMPTVDGQIYYFLLKVTVQTL